MLAQLPCQMSDTHINRLYIDFHAEIVVNQKEFYLETAALVEFVTIELNGDFFLFEFSQ
jgi:hypothetical protein